MKKIDLLLLLVLFCAAGCVGNTKLWRELGKPPVYMVERGRQRTFWVVMISYSNLWACADGYLVTDPPKDSHWWMENVVRFSPQHRDLSYLNPTLGWLTRDQPTANRTLWVIGNNPPIIAIGDSPAPTTATTLPTTRPRVSDESEIRFIQEGDWENKADTVIALDHWEEEHTNPQWVPIPDDRQVFKLDHPMTLREIRDTSRRWLGYAKW